MGQLSQPFLDYFMSRGCRVDEDPDYQERYLIDFIVTRMAGVHSAVNLGVRFTRSTDDFEAQEVLLEAARRGVVAKCIYIELCADDLDTGIVPITGAACLSYLFDRRYQHAKAHGLRVFEDTTFHFFDVEDNVRRLRKEKHDAAHEDTAPMEGEIIAYFADKGFGFIEESPGNKFFFHIANVRDEQLRADLPAYAQGDVIPVYFAYGGSEGKKYPKAVEVRVID